MKVINVCDADWANFSYDNMIALRAVGIDCIGAKLQDHVFGYKNTIPKTTEQEMKDLMADCDVIQFFHDNVHLFRGLIPHFGNKKVITYHTSSYFRKNYDVVNSAMNPYVYRSVNAMPEFMGMGAKHEVYMVGAVDTASLAPQGYHVGEMIKIAHYPSNPKVKGTKKINDLMSSIDAPHAMYTCKTDPVPHHIQMLRMSDCDIYVEMFTEVDGNGMPYGNFGITALEAAAMGKLVVTNCKGILHYAQAYGKPFFYIADDEEQFRYVLQTMLDADRKKLAELQQQKRALVHINHGYQATGEYFIKNVL